VYVFICFTVRGAHYLRANIRAFRIFLIAVASRAKKMRGKKPRL